MDNMENTGNTEVQAVPAKPEKKERSVPLSITILVVLMAMIITFMATFVAVYSVKTEGGSLGTNGALPEFYDELSEIKAYFDNIYIGEIDDETLTDAVISGYVVGSGDKYAYYYNEEAYKELRQELQGDMQGIGVMVIYNADYKGIEIINVFPDSPAMDAGVEPGDLIVYVGDELESVAYLGYEGALKKLQGEAGTVAKFVAYRGDNYTEEHKFEIERSFVTEQTVDYRVYSLDSSVGIIKITSFDTKTVEQFKNAVSALQAEGVTKLVFDVRNNPGGELVSICTILDSLLPEGPIIRTVDKSGTETTPYKSDEAELDMPMAVIVNGSTASAAELFTSALMDYEKATVVGTLTYGKGCMQSIFPLQSGGALSLTTALYYPPFSENYNEIGITPDVVVELEGEAAEKNIYKLTDEEDTQLKAAVASFAD
ncbi:MAG: hypothetical protein E7660_07820 [Ruminococcaceae bacterium]|nr:hypothetical protein [Oscillospiraceae bacterium]